ncbi:MAG: SemiSWEET transporter [Patescibacteria group bacterium]
MNWHIVGGIAAILTTFSFLPQVIKMKQTKSVNDVSLVTMLQLSIGVLLWIVYGIYLNNPIIISANSVTFVLLLTGLVLFFKHKK